MDRKASGEVSKGEVPKPKENVGSGSEDKVMKAPGVYNIWLKVQVFIIFLPSHNLHECHVVAWWNTLHETPQDACMDLYL